MPVPFFQKVQKSGFMS